MPSTTLRLFNGVGSESIVWVALATGLRTWFLLSWSLVSAVSGQSLLTTKSWCRMSLMRRVCCPRTPSLIDATSD